MGTGRFVVSLVPRTRAVGCDLAPASRSVSMTRVAKPACLSRALRLASSARAYATSSRMSSSRLGLTTSPGWRPLLGGRLPPAVSLKLGPLVSGPRTGHAGEDVS